MNQTAVLVFPACTEIGLEIFKALSTCKSIRLFGAGETELDSSKLIYNEYQTLPNVHDDAWLNKLITLCATYCIDYIFPAHDDAIVSLAKHSADIPAIILGPPYRESKILRSKTKTYRSLQKVVKTPQVFTLPSPDNLPVFIKPDVGEGAKDAYLVSDWTHLSYLRKNIKNPVITEYLPGEEYTIDCFSKKGGELLFYSARQRLRIKNGIAVVTNTVDVPDAGLIVEKISTHFKMRGAWFAQLKRDKNNCLTLLEVANRISGSMACSRALGVNFAELTILERNDAPLTVLNAGYNVRLFRSLQNFYEISPKIKIKNLYIDLDDTLIFENNLNPDAMAVIVACRNKKIPVFVVTRHGLDPRQTINQFGISGLIDHVIHVKNDELKSHKIDKPDAIFVDDSFSERAEVANKLKIPTFDTSSLDLLRDIINAI